MGYKEMIAAYKGNIGLLYTKTYFKFYDKCEKDEKGNCQLNFNKLDVHLDTLQNKVFLDTSSIPEQLGNLEFKLITIYPGLLIGSGYSHEVSGDDALKLGFFFDHTTGLPCIPGSSIKGVLRDACEKDNGKYLLSIIDELASGERTIKDNKEEITKLAVTSLQKDDTSKFVQIVFEGEIVKDEQLSLIERDIFFDAFPEKSYNDKNKYLANDYITPHTKPLKNPKPIQFLKVLPQVKFRFDFKLTDNVMNKELKLELFRQILLDLGVGAKTNVGYGQFTDEESITISDSSNGNSTSKSYKRNKNINNIQRQNQQQDNIKRTTAQITKIKKDKYEFQYESNGFTLKKQKSKKEVLDVLKIKENEINKHDKFTIELKNMNEFKIIKKIN